MYVTDAIFAVCYFFATQSRQFVHGARGVTGLHVGKCIVCRRVTQIPAIILHVIGPILRRERDSQHRFRIKRVLSSTPSPQRNPGVFCFGQTGGVVGLAESELQPKRSESMTSMANVGSTYTAHPHSRPPWRGGRVISTCHLMGSVNPSFICNKPKWGRGGGHYKGVKVTEKKQIPNRPKVTDLKLTHKTESGSSKHFSLIFVRYATRI